MSAGINGISSMMGSVPGLTQDDTMVPYCNAGNLPDGCNSTSVCHCTHLVELNYHQPYAFLLQAPGGIQLKQKKCFITETNHIITYHSAVNGTTNHPIHLHGYAFEVIDMGTLAQYQNNQTAFAKAKHLPVIKDTVMVPSGGIVLIKFKACNPGYWYMHCHFEYHMLIGMMVILKVGNYKDVRKPPANFPRCGDFLQPLYHYGHDH